MSTTTQMLTTHPQPTDLDRQALSECIESCFECVQSCVVCADACLSEDGVAELRGCIRLNLDCADVCDATGRLLSRQGSAGAGIREAQLEACRRACEACERECRSHADHHEHCRVCAEVCAACASACAQLLS